MSLQHDSDAAQFAACTIIAKNYLPMARVLAESWHRFHPKCPMYVLLLDSSDGFFRPEAESFITVPVADLEIDNLNGFLFKYSVLEASTAVKPYLVKYLFRRYSLRKLLYLDPDILIVSSLDGLRDGLSSANILLTPHLTSPLPEDGLLQSEHDILKSGAYNLGFIGMRAGEDLDRLLDWWCGKLYHHCLVNIEGNLFVDQRWMDLVPGLFPGVSIVRDPGYNMAYWNLHERRLLFNERIVVNGRFPLFFFHFSGYDADKPWIVSKHQTRFDMTNIGETRRIYAEYRDLLIRHGWNDTKNWKYEHDFFRNGIKIPSSARRFYWNLGPDVDHLGDPFTWLEGPHASSVEDEHVTSRSDDMPAGINVLGYFESEKGVGEGARSNLRIIQATGLPYVANNWSDLDSRNMETFTGKFSDKNPYSANLITVNADQMVNFARQQQAYLAGHYNIGYWAWELSDFPEQWATSFSYLDEVWTPSRFTCDAVSSSSPIPVKVVPHSMDPSTSYELQVDRAEFQIEPDMFVFLFAFDFHSYMERKNPFGLIRAFKKAFGNRKDVLLLLKGCHGDAHPDDLSALRTASVDANIRIVDRIFSRETTGRLMMAADCYISLHRSEGFGLTLAEAMMLGKPVIATGYSGNVDFMSDADSFLVPYRITKIAKTHGPYKAGYHWADPNLDSAADIMRHVEKNREAALAVGATASVNIRRLLHPSRIAASVRERCEQIGMASKDHLADSATR